MPAVDINLVYEMLVMIFILLSAFFSGTETAIVSADRIKVQSRAHRGSRRAAKALFILDNIEDAMGLVLIGNNIVNVAATAFITFLVTKAFMLDETGLIIVTAVQTMVFLMACEITPKVVARANADSFLINFSYVLYFLMYLLWPIIRASLFFARLIKRDWKEGKTSGSLLMSREEIDTLFRIGTREGVIDREDQEFVSEMLSFKKITAREVMTPTIDIQAIENTGSMRELVSLIDRTRFSRIPVYEKRVDNITGYVFYRDIILNRQASTAGELKISGIYVPATKNVFELYREMQDNSIPVVFVVNEYGAVIGMVTDEDIAEEVVGEIQTGDHPEDDIIRKISSRKYILDGNIDVDFFNKKFSQNIPRKGFETIAGFITWITGRIPRRGEQIEYEKCLFKIEKASERSVEQVIVRLPSRGTETDRK